MVNKKRLLFQFTKKKVKKMKHAIKKLLKFITGDWEMFYIYRKNIQHSNSTTSVKHKELNFITKEIGTEHYRMSLQDNRNEMCSLCVIWGNEYKVNFRNYIPLKCNEAKIIDVFTPEEYRGKGYIGKLLTHTENEMFSRGITTLLARIWHSNISSKKAFEKSGWVYAGFKLELKLLNRFPVSYSSSL